jgi:hypothetical protein
LAAYAEFVIRHSSFVIFPRHSSFASKESPMNNPAGNRGGLAYVAAVLGALLIVLALIWAMREYTQPPPLAANRPAERAKARMELDAANKDALLNVGWIDQSKGLVRLPIQDSMKLIERVWQNPPAARSNLIARAEKAFYVPPPPKNPFD